MVSTSVYLAHARLPTAHAWQRILDEAGLPLELDTGVNLHDFVGLLPVRYRGQESGFEYFLEQDTQPPDAFAESGPDRLDTCVTLVARSPLEARAATVAAAALAALTGGVAYDDAEGRGYAPTDAIAWARRIVTQDDGHDEWRRIADTGPTMILRTEGGLPMDRTGIVRSVDGAPQVYARLGGGLYLVIIALGIVAQVVVRDQLVVPGDAAATAQNLTAMESWWRLGIGSEALALLCTLALAMIYFALLRPISLELSILAALLRAVSVAVQAVAVVQLDLALSPLTNAAFTAAFTPDQRAVLATLAVRAHSRGYTLALLIVGAAFLIHGLLIIRSAFLPKALGLLIQVAGVGYLVNGFTVFLAPAFAGPVFLVIMLPVFIGETSVSLWLLIKGVNVERWHQAAGSGRPTP